MSAVELAGPSATVADKLPALIAGAGERAIDYFVVNIRHRNTRAAVRVNSQRSPHCFGSAGRMTGWGFRQWLCHFPLSTHAE